MIGPRFIDPRSSIHRQGRPVHTLLIAFVGGVLALLFMALLAVMLVP
jgi:hypothetical protein